jgi:hypothetical protein
MATFSGWVQKWINQIAHAGWGAFLFMALHQRVIGWQALLAVVTFATLKEGIFDPLTETVAEKGSGLQDWVFWMLGLALGIVASL